MARLIVSPEFIAGLLRDLAEANSRFDFATAARIKALLMSVQA